MKRKKMLISIALIVIMLLNCIAPMLEAQAATAKTTMTFNSALYKGLKAFFQESNIKAVYNDGLHTIKMENSVIAGLEGISLKEKGISDITGLDQFTGLKSLIISANNLNENSNLEVLNNLPNLSYLDISSNQISDISSIQTLVERLISLDSNAINLSGQTVKTVVDISLDSSEQKTEVECSLPQILQIAGITNNGRINNKGILKADWVSGKYYGVSNDSTMYPYIIDESIPNPISSANDSFKIKVGADTNGNYVPYQGLVKWVISIKDTSTVSYNVNPASQNLLKDSIFTLYYVVHKDSYESVIFNDNNFYTSVKEQLTKDQTINSDLISYKYNVDKDEEIYYDICDLSLSGNVATLKINDEVLYKIYNFNSYGYDGKAIIKKGTSTDDYEIQYYEVEHVDSYSESGVLTRTLKVKVPHYNEESRNLYIDSYDEPLALVITDLDLINKITSLIINDQRIEDLSGLEKFIGLESNLNVSYNYIDTLANIYTLQLNKEESNQNLQNVFTTKRDAMSKSKEKVNKGYADANSAIKSIKDEIAKIESAIQEAGNLDSTKENYDEELTKYADKVKESEKAINGDGTSDNPGLIDKLYKALNDEQEGLNINLVKLYTRLAAMYNVYNKEYKLTSLLIPELNYQTEEEYESFIEKIKTLNGAKELVTNEFARISTLEKAGALSALEKDLIKKALGLSTSSEEEYPISKALEDLISDLNETEAPRSSWTSIIDGILEVDIYSQAENYCLLKRMNNSTAEGECYVEEYLKGKIEEFEYEGIDTDLVTAVYEMITTGLTQLSYNHSLYRIFVTYQEEIRNTSNPNGTVYICKGGYDKVSLLKYEETTSTVNLGSQINYTSSIKLVEYLTTLGKNTRDIYFYNQLMALANKFTALNEIDRYVVLPSLKKVDVRNNEIETLGNIVIGTEEVTENQNVNGEEAQVQTTKEITSDITSLNKLKEFYAGHNIVTGDISCVDWSKMTSLKKLDLSYNYITDILPLQGLKNLRYLDVSDNLLSGEFNLSLKQMPKIKDVILAGNKYTDINKILIDYEMEAQGDFTRYFARKDTLNIDLSRQELEIDLTEQPIAYDSSSSVYEVELPPIFAQLEFIDAQRTAYGITSSKGTITARGGKAYIPVSKTGEYEGIVTVIAANGYPEDVTTSFGLGSNCTIKYKVLNIKVNSVEINEQDLSRVERGTSVQLSATVNGENIPDTTVEWDVSGSIDGKSTITADGVLTVGSDETAEQITIIATSNYDDTVEATKVISLFSKEVTNVVVTGDDKVSNGETATYIATVEGNNLEDSDKAVIWTVEGNSSSETTITGEGILTIGADETAEKVTVKATSAFDAEKYGQLEVTVEKQSVLPTLGYALDSNEDIVGVLPYTTVQSFKSKLLSDNTYDIIVKRDEQQLMDTSYVGTGDFVIISKDEVPVDGFEVVVKGDVSGDGKVKKDDIKLIKAHIGDVEILTDCSFKAADVNNDNKINKKDIVLILSYISGVIDF